MTFRQGLISARHHIVFLFGLCAAFGLVIYLETLDTGGTTSSGIYQLDKRSEFSIASPAPLSTTEQNWARVAWRYFENNYQEETGLVNSVDNYTATTMWDTSSYLLGLIAAYRLQLITDVEFNKRLGKILHSMASLSLFEDKLPNKSYNTVTLAMVDYNNKPSEYGIGWSAIDIGRVLVPLNIIAWNYPQHVEAVKTIIKRWDFDALLQEGVMYGAAVDEQRQVELVQEGRIGYEEYAAKSLSLLGKDVSQALAYADFLNFITIYGQDIPTDSRDPERYHAHNYVVSESYILDGLEFGWDHISKEFAYRVFKVQEQRYKDLGILTAVSEDNIDEAPYFVYNTVFTSGKSWNAITEDGQDASDFKTLSTKAAFGWHVLYKTAYTQKLMDKVSELHEPDKGWYSGWYENKHRPNQAITANTNGIILESLAYRQFGKLVDVYPDQPVNQSISKEEQSEDNEYAM